MKAPVQEMLYDAIDQLRVPQLPKPTVAAGSQQAADTTVEIKSFCIILATDQPGDLQNALEKRMVLKVALTFYTVDELKEVVERMATDAQLLLSPHAAKLIAKVSAGIPRRAQHHLQKLRNHFLEAEQQQITLDQVREYLRAFRIDDKGLGPEEHLYLEYLKEVVMASLESLAIHLGLDSDYVRHHVESPLLRERLVKIGIGGRQLTPTGRALLAERSADLQETSNHG
jgi:holliday junction DNA helicase RuvB